MSLNYLRLHNNFLEEMELLTMEERGRLVTALLMYWRTGAIDEDTLSGNERYLFPVCRNRVDLDREAYEDMCALNRKNGALGGRPSKKRAKAQC